MIASKVVCDDTYSNKSWAIVGQHMFTLKEINQMEREMCGYLEWLLNIDPNELKAFELAVKDQYGPNSAIARAMGTSDSATILSRPFTFPTSPVLYNDNAYDLDEEDPGSPYHSSGNSPVTSTLSTPPAGESYPVPDRDGKSYKYVENLTDPRYLYVYSQNTIW